METIFKKAIKTLNGIGPSLRAALYHAPAAPFGAPSSPFPLSQTAIPLYIHGERAASLRKLIPTRVFTTQFLIADKRSVHNEEVRDADSLFNLPNMISLARMTSGPFLGWVIVNEYYSIAFVGLAISGASDWLDGFVARRMNINSVMGSYLDPLADKVLVGCVALSMMKMDLLHPALVALVVLRDIALFGGAVYKRASNLGWQWKGWYDFMNLDASRPEKLEPIFISKVNTVFQLTLVAASLLQPEFGSDETSTYITGLSWLVAATTVASWAGYGMLYNRSRSVPNSDICHSISRSKPS